MPWLARRKHIPSHGLSFLFSHWKQRASLGVAGRTMAGEPLGVEGGGPSGSLEEGLKGWEWPLGPRAILRLSLPWPSTPGWATGTGIPGRRPCAKARCPWSWLAGRDSPGWEH